MRPDPSAARILAIFALFVAALGVIVVIAGSLGGSTSGSGTGTRGAHHSSAGPRQHYYVVQAGDTFVGIADKENIPLPRLERLNPKLDTQLIPERGCVNLVPEGCKELAAGG
jgi:hypothetical protein